ncbi:carboxylesterase/lipase family protein [Alkalibacterium olivapovliticus]|uniref:Carboxylic ester hydrolase n=1 Tax=Alkalibacterium olivapovliticus TaxID=99907 RepID=A0A2T0W850_9LACT|nr:carboxylesterase family protein [Alkalibacterium olivapovliticus]PRY82862.1 para-nitrobenzyl esterase [Alkalibacterium olivapovliticus]
MLRKVKIENGIIQGLPAADPRITTFKGIPFAAPPVGQNRWHAPQPAQNWEGTLKAFEFAPISMQATPGLNKDDFYAREWHVDPDVPMDEDNLYLNIWTPASSSDENLPVYVWFFGGAFQYGYTSEMEFDGERLARRGAIIVTVNYRLNSFGFLAHPELTAEAPGAPTNFGLLDQQAGIKWVKRNIASFGGDPDNITIGGQSAGGGSVMHHLTAPQNKGLFNKAVILSGIFANVYGSGGIPGSGRTLSQVENEGVTFFDFLGVSSLAEARELDGEELRQKALEYKSFWGPVIDKQFVMGNALTLFLENKRLMVPVLLGHTSDEFYSKPNVDSLDEFKKMAIERFGSDADDYLNLCQFESGNLNDVLSNASVRTIEYAIRIAGQANSDRGAEMPLYYYNFDPEIPGWDNPGTFHSADLWFFFETLAKGWRPFTGKHYDLARQMSNYLVNFISSGNPNGKETNEEDMPEWEPYTAEATYAMVFGDTAKFLKEQPDELMAFLVKQYFKKD